MNNEYPSCVCTQNVIIYRQIYIKMHQSPQLKCLSSRLAAVFAQFIQVRC